jgi:hypothetical protein
VSDKKHSIWRKVFEIILEIIIIVFAVTLSINLHSWSEHRHEQKQVKTFLTGLKKDIQSDVSDTKDILGYFRFYDTLYTFLSRLDQKKKPDVDSLQKMIPHINTNIFLQPHRTRFNGFLTSGKITTIEQEELTLQILNYYQEKIPSLQNSEGGWISKNNDLNNYIQNNLKNNSSLAYWEVLCSPKAKYLTLNLIPWRQLIDRYQDIIDSGRKIIDEIDKLYPGVN